MTSAESGSRKTSLLVQWFAVLGGPLAWAAHLGVSYTLVPFVCASGLTILLHLTTLVAALVASSADVVAFWTWRSTGVGEQTDVGGTVGRTAFMAIAGIFMSSLFLLIILVEGSGNFFLSPCRLQEEMQIRQLPHFLYFFLAPGT